MRRGGGRGGSGGGGYYTSDSSVGNSNAHGGYAPSQSPPQQQHQQLNKSDNHPSHSQWRWERDASKIHSPMSPHTFNEGQGSETSRSYFQGHRLDPRMAQGKQGSHDVPRGEVVDAGNDRDPVSHTFDGIEKKFVDDLMKLSKEQSDAEDAEIARHREAINSVNSKYEEQLVALRARHESRRDELLQRESQSRRQHYQQATLDHFHGASFAPSDPQGYSGISAPPSDPRRSYPGEDYNSYRERDRFLGSARNHELEPRGQYPGGRMQDAGPRYY